MRKMRLISRSHIARTSSSSAYRNIGQDDQMKPAQKRLLRKCYPLRDFWKRAQLFTVYITSYHHTMYFPINPQRAILTILSILLTIFPLSRSFPRCQNPPPARALLPSLSDCRNLVNAIWAIGEVEEDADILWSRHPSIFYRNHQLPWVFRGNHPSSDCEFVVDTIRDNEYDRFPTWMVAEAAHAIVEECIARGIRGIQTLGGTYIEPKEVITVIVGKRNVGGGMREGLVHLNLTNVTLTRPGRLLGPLSSTVEEG